MFSVKCQSVKRALGDLVEGGNKGIPDLQKQDESPLQIVRQELWLDKTTQLCKLFAIITAYLMSTNISVRAVGFTAFMCPTLYV